MKSMGVLLAVVVIIGSLNAFVAETIVDGSEKTNQQVQDLLSQQRMSLLKEVGPKFPRDLSNPFFYVYAADKVMKKLFIIYRDNVYDIKGFTRRGKYTKLYNLYVTEPCEKVLALNEKLDSSGETKEELFTSMVEMCVRLKGNDRFFKKSYDHFKSEDDYVKDWDTEEALENHERFKKGEMTY